MLQRRITTRSVCALPQLFTERAMRVMSLASRFINCL